MIRRVHVRDPRSTPVRWMPSVPWLQQGPIDLGPGLTFIFGPNGAGKSTFILALSRLFHCAQGGRQVVTIESVRAVVDDATDALLGGVDVLHDAAPVSCFDASKIVGFAGSQFDDDFFDEGLENLFRGRSSSGESMHGRLRAMLRQTRVPVEDRTTESYNDIWRKRVDDYEKADAKVQGIAKAIWPLVRRKVKSIDYADPTGRLLYTVMGEES